MNTKKSSGGLIKKTAAVLLSMAMAFGAVSVLPNSAVDNSVTVASAEKDRTDLMQAKANDCTFYFSFTERTGSKTISIEDADIDNDDGTVSIPSEITFEGTKYTVTDIGANFLENNTSVTSVVIPDSVTYVDDYFCMLSTVEHISIPDNMEHLGYGFGAHCYNLKYHNVSYSGTKIVGENMGGEIFVGSLGMFNSNGAVTLGNWLIRYDSDMNSSEIPTYIKIADLGIGNTKLDSIADFAAVGNNTVVNVDLEGVKYIGKSNFVDFKRLLFVSNADIELTESEGSFENTPWLVNNKTNNDSLTIEINDCIFSYEIVEKLHVETLVLKDVQILNDDGIVEIPSKIKAYNGMEYDVTYIDKYFLRDNKEVKEVIMPDSITYVDTGFAMGSTVESLTISKNLKHLGSRFCMNCKELKYQNVVYEGSDIVGTNMTANVFSNCPGMVNEKKAICLGNWLIKYRPDEDITSVKIADLGNGEAKIDSIAYGAFQNNDSIHTVDLESVKYIGAYNFESCRNLSTVLNDDSVTVGEKNIFGLTPWLSNAQENGLVKIGEVLMYYRLDSDSPDSNIIDLRANGLENTKHVLENAFVDCPNADTLYCSSDCMLDKGCFYAAYTITDPDLAHDPAPEVPVYKIKNIYLDGEKLEFSKELPQYSPWVTKNYPALEKSAWLQDNLEAKVKALFDQLDLTYLGIYNDEYGMLSKTEEFYAMLKIHDYLSTYDYDYPDDYDDGINAFLVGGKVNCEGYAQINQFLLGSAGVRSLSLSSSSVGRHAWNEIKIGDEWFESDDGWDSQLKHKYDWFAISSAYSDKIDGKSHFYVRTKRSWHSTEYYNDRIIAERLLGDINDDLNRNSGDMNSLWKYIENPRGNSIDRTKADINFDGTVNITDAVLLYNILYGHAVDPENYPTDGLAPGYTVAFADGNNRDSIQYDKTDRDGYYVLPELMYEAPNGMRFDGWTLGEPGEKVKISNPYTVIQPKWVLDRDDDSSSKAEDSSSKPDSSSSKPDSSSSKTDSSSSKPDSSSSKPDSSSSKTDDSSSKTDNSSSKPDSSSSKTDDSSSKTDNSSSKSDSSSSKPDDSSSKPDSSSSKTDDSSSKTDDSKPDTDKKKWLLGDVDGNGVIDIEDATMIIGHINGMKALDDEQMLRADVDKSDSIDISDAVEIINHINGVRAIDEMI